MIKTLKDIIVSGRYYKHHTAMASGYVSRKIEDMSLPAVEYKGRYGKGFIVDKPNYNSSRFVYREYWILKNN